MIRTDIEQWLTAAFQNEQLTAGITVAHLSDLAEALVPIVTNFESQKQAAPSRAILATMANNLFHDGAQVRDLIDRSSPEAIYGWCQLEHQLQQKARLNWPDIGSFYQEEIVSQTLQRIQRYLPKFQFQARFSTWVHTILKREFLRLQAKIEREQCQEISLQANIGENFTVGEIVSNLESPATVAEKRNLVSMFEHRLNMLLPDMDRQILRLHSAGYKLAEIKKILDNLYHNSPSLTTIKRRKDRVIISLQNDPEIRSIAMELGW